jgi:hypothetical protein
MASIDRNFEFATNGTVSAASLHNLIDSATIFQGLITDREPTTTVGTEYQMLIADATNANAAPNSVTVFDLFQDALTAGTYTNANISEALTYGTATGTRLVSTNATITTGTITTGVIPTLTSSTATLGTTTSTAATITSGTITNLASTTGTIATLNSTTGTIATLNSTTGTIGTLNSTTGTIGNFTTTLTGDVTISTGSATVGTRVAVVDTAQEYTRCHNFNATALTITSGTVSWNLAENQVATLEVTTNSTMDTPTNPQAGATYVLIVTQGTSGNNTLSYSTAYKFSGGDAPVLSTGSAQVDVLSFISDGTVLYGVASQNFS